MNIHNPKNGRSVLATLRATLPERSLRFSEALRMAELQAIKLLDILGVEDVIVPNEVVTELPRIRIERRDMPTSGLSYWDGQYWVIALNRREPRTRQRFTLFHEYKHILDHGHVGDLYGNSDQRAEQAADYFAGCVLMSRKELKRAWAAGIQQPAALARHFDVSERAVSVRLAQVGLTDQIERCSPRTVVSLPARHSRYFRQLSTSWRLQRQEQAA